MSLCVAIYSLNEDVLRLDCFTSVEDVSQALERVFAEPSGRVAVDLAFQPLATNAVKAFLEGSDCRVCLSERAVSLLSDRIVRDTAVAGAVCGVTFYAGFPAHRSRDFRPILGREGARGWVASLARTDHELTRQLLTTGIFDESSYQQNERLLSPHLRVAAARARYLQLAGRPPDAVEILDNVASCPPWVVGTRLMDLPLTVRQANVLRAHSLRTVGELSRLGNSGLFKLPNLGLKSVRELGETLYELMLREPVGAAPLMGAQDEVMTEVALPHADGSFIELLRDELSSYGGIADAVILERWGLSGERKTLQQLAEVHGVTRERIRQIEVKAAERLRGASVWVTFAQHIDALLDSRDIPLWIDRLPAEDPWFGDHSWLTSGLATCIDLFLRPRFHLFEIKERMIVSALSADEWNRIIEDCKLILGPDRPRDDNRLCRLTTAVLVARGTELRGELNRHLAGRGADDEDADALELDPDTALSRQLERALLEQTLSRTSRP